MSRLAEARRSAGITQDRLAALSGVHRVTIARYETGKIAPTVTNLIKLADALGVTVDEIVDRVG